MISMGSACRDRVQDADLPSGSVLGLECQFGCAIWSRSNLPYRRLDGITRPDRRREPDPIISQRVWIVVSYNSHDRSGNETKCAQPVDNDTPEARRLTYLGVYVKLGLAYVARVPRQTSYRYAGGCSRHSSDTG